MVLNFYAAPTMAQPAFGKATLARVVQNTGTLTTQLLAGWEQAARRGEPVDVLNDMQQLAMRVIGMALFSRDLENDLQAGLADTAARHPRGTRGANCFTETVRAGVQVVALRNVSPAPLPLWVPTRLHRRFRRGLTAVDRFVHARIDERLADPGGYDDMLADLVRSYGDQAAAADTRRELRDQVVTLFFAGFETTAVALAWTWLLLGQHQAAEARFHQELAAVLGGRAAGRRGPEGARLHRTGRPGVHADVPARLHADPPGGGGRRDSRFRDRRDDDRAGGRRAASTAAARVRRTRHDHPRRHPATGRRPADARRGAVMTAASGGYGTANR